MIEVGYNLHRYGGLYQLSFTRRWMNIGDCIAQQHRTVGTKIDVFQTKKKLYTLHSLKHLALVYKETKIILKIISIF